MASATIIDTFITAVTTKNATSIAQSCHKLWAIMAVHNLTTQDTLRLAPTLLEMVAYGETHRRCSAAGVLAAMLLQSDARAILAATESIAQPLALCLLSLMDTPSVDAKRVACSVVANGAVDPRFTATLLEFSVVNKVVNALTWMPSVSEPIPWTSVVDVRCAAALALARLAQHPLATPAFDCPMLPRAVVKLLLIAPDDTRKVCTALLHMLLKGHPHHTAAVVKHGGLRALVQVMCTYSDCPTTLEHCMGALVVMAVYNPSYLSDMQQHGLVQQLCDVLHTHALPPLHLSAAKLLALAAGQPTLRDDLAQHTACSLLCKLTATYAASTEQEALVHVVTGNEDGGGIQHGGGNEHGSGVLGSNVHGSKHDIDLYEHGQYKKKFRGKQRPVVYASMYSAATWLDACLLHPLVPGGMDDQSNAYTEGSNADIKGSNGDIEAAAAASFPPQPPQQHSLSLSPAPSATPSARTHPKTAAQPATVQPMTCTKRQVDRDVAFCAVVALMQVSSEEQGVVMLSALGYVKHLLMLLDAAVLDVPMQIIILQSISNMMVPSHPDAPLLLLSNNGLSTLCALATHRSRKRARCLGCSVTQGALECIAMLAGHADASVVHAVDAQVGAVLPVLQAHVGTRNEAAAGCAMAALAMLLSRRGNVGRIYKFMSKTAPLPIPSPTLRKTCSTPASMAPSPLSSSSPDAYAQSHIPLYKPASARLPSLQYPLANDGQHKEEHDGQHKEEHDGQHKEEHHVEGVEHAHHDDNHTSTAHVWDNLPYYTANDHDGDSHAAKQGAQWHHESTGGPCVHSTQGNSMHHHSRGPSTNGSISPATTGNSPPGSPPRTHASPYTRQGSLDADPQHVVQGVGRTHEPTAMEESSGDPSGDPAVHVPVGGWLWDDPPSTRPRGSQGPSFLKVGQHMPSSPPSSAELSSPAMHAKTPTHPRRLMGSQSERGGPSSHHQHNTSGTIVFNHNTLGYPARQSLHHHSPFAAAAAGGQTKDMRNNDRDDTLCHDTQYNGHTQHTAAYAVYSKPSCGRRHSMHSMHSTHSSLGSKPSTSGSWSFARTLSITSALSFTSNNSTLQSSKQQLSCPSMLIDVLNALKAPDPKHRFFATSVVRSLLGWYGSHAVLVHKLDVLPQLLRVLVHSRERNTAVQALAALQAVSYPRSPHASRLKLLHTPQLLSTLLGLACGQQHLPCLPHMTIAYSTYTTTDVYGFTHDVHACDVDVPTLDVDVYARDGDAGNVYVHEAVRSGDVWGHDEGVVRGHSMHTAALRVIGDGQGDCGHVSGGQGACEGPLRDTSMYAAGHWVQQQEGLDRWTSLCLDDAMMMQQTGGVDEDGRAMSAVGTPGTEEDPRMRFALRASQCLRNLSGLLDEARLVAMVHYIRADM